MSKSAPRNATIKVLDHDTYGLCVLKQYRATYTAREEFEAYQRLVPVLENHCRIRAAKIYEIDDSSNSLWIEYIPGATLYDSARQGNLEPVTKWEEALLSLFATARERDVRFDADPSNFVASSNTDELVLIDPVCQDLGMSEFNCVVFVWGLMKLILRDARLWRYPSITRVIRSYLQGYMIQTDTEAAALELQMSQYIDIVIRWNKEISDVDSTMLIFIRRCIAIPIYTIFKLLFARNLMYAIDTPSTNADV